jgi:hypothetical protein
MNKVRTEYSTSLIYLFSILQNSRPIIYTISGRIAAIIGAINQLRILGAVIGLAISATALSNYVKSRLASVLSPEQLSQLIQSSGSIAQFPPEQAAATRGVYNDAYNLQMRIVMGFAIVSLVVSLLAFRRHPLDLNAAGLGEGERVETVEHK